MRTERFGGLTVRITGGSDGQGGGKGPVVVLLHGFGAPGDDLVVLSELLEVPEDVRFVFPEAPLELSGSFGSSRAWWMLDMERLQRDIMSGAHSDRSSEVPANLAEVRGMVSAMLDDLETALDVDGARIILGGFSQGSMLACDVALQTERPLAGLALLSTTLIAAEQWIPAMSRRVGLPLFLSHGRKDPLLSFATAERLRDLFADAGLEVLWHDYPFGHEIPPTVLRSLGAFITGVLNADGNAAELFGFDADDDEYDEDEDDEDYEDEEDDEDEAVNDDDGVDREGHKRD